MKVVNRMMIKKILTVNLSFKKRHKAQGDNSPSLLAESTVDTLVLLVSVPAKTSVSSYYSKEKRRCENYKKERKRRNIMGNERQAGGKFALERIVRMCVCVCVCVRQRERQRESEFSGLLQAGVSEIRLDSDLEVYLSWIPWAHQDRVTKILL